MNSHAPGYQVKPAVAMDDQDRFIVVWAGDAKPGTGTGVFARRFKPAGEPLRAEFQVGGPAGHYHGPNAVAADATGFVVVWEYIHKYAPDFGFLRRYDEHGGPVTKAVSLGLVQAGGVAMDGRGNSVVVAESSVGKGISGRRFDAAGREIGNPFRIARPGSILPQVAFGGPGEFVVVWRHPGGIFGKRFDSTAQLLEPRFRVTSEPARPTLAAGDDGRFMVAWRSSQGIFVQIYEPSGEPKLSLVSTDGAPFGALAPIAMDSSGRSFIAWTSSKGSIRGRCLDRSGSRQGRERQISSVTDDPLWVSQVAAGSPGRFVVVWERYSGGYTGNADVFAALVRCPS